MQAYVKMVLTIFVILIIGIGCGPDELKTATPIDGQEINDPHPGSLLEPKKPVAVIPVSIPPEDVAALDVPLFFPVYPLFGGSGGQRTICGNGRVEGKEECDDRNLNDNDACNSDCTLPPSVLALSKTGVLDGTFTAGQTISYTITVTNIGQVVSTNIVVTDSLLPDASIDCGALGDNIIETLAVGASMNCTATYTITADDVTAGTVSNTASAIDDDGTQASDTFVPSIFRMTLEKTGMLNGSFATGETISYTITVTNTGNQVLNGIEVTDTLLSGAQLDCGGGAGDTTIETLAVGASAMCTGTYTITADDVTAGTVSNTASAIDDDGTQASDTFVPSIFKMTLEKTGVLNGPFATDETISYTITVTNAGNQVLNGIDVTDTLLSSAMIDCGGGAGDATIETLAVGASAQCTGTYTIGNEITVSNTASAESNEGAQASDTVVISAMPAMDIQKLGVLNGAFATDETISYTIIVTNSGNTVLSNISVTDTLIPGAQLNCGDGAGDTTIETLAVWDSAQCTGTYTITSGDVNNGSVVNTATARGMIEVSTTFRLASLAF